MQRGDGQRTYSSSTQTAALRSSASRSAKVFSPWHSTSSALLLACGVLRSQLAAARAILLGEESLGMQGMACSEWTFTVLIECNGAPCFYHFNWKWLHFYCAPTLRQPGKHKFAPQIGYPTTLVLVLGAAAPKRRVLGDERAIGCSVDGLDLLLGREGQVETLRLAVARPVAPGVGAWWARRPAVRDASSAELLLRPRAPKAPAGRVAHVGADVELEADMESSRGLRTTSGAFSTPA